MVFAGWQFPVINYYIILNVNEIHRLFKQSRSSVFVLVFRSDTLTAMLIYNEQSMQDLFTNVRTNIILQFLKECEFYNKIVTILYVFYSYKVHCNDDQGRVYQNCKIHDRWGSFLCQGVAIEVISWKCIISLIIFLSTPRHRLDKLSIYDDHRRVYQNCKFMTRGTWVFVLGCGHVSHLVKRHYFFFSTPRHRSYKLRVRNDDQGRVYQIVVNIMTSGSGVLVLEHSHIVKMQFSSVRVYTGAWIRQI